MLYAQADTVQYLAPVTEDHEIDYNKRLTIPGIVVLGGKMRIGIKNLGEMSARWAGGDEFKLIRTGDLDDDSHRQYMTARQQAEEFARTHFFKDESDASAYVINPACQREDTYAWTVTNNGTNTGEASDGQSSNAYWNLWKGSAYTSTMTQDIPYLPEGRYAATALLRGNDAANISLTATVVSPKPENEGEVTITIKPTGNTSAAGSPYQNGWQLAETPYITVRPGDTLRLTMKADIPGSGWWSADNFGLLWQYVEPLPDGLIQIKNEELRIKNDIFDLSGRKVSRMTKKGVYIKGGKKVIK